MVATVLLSCMFFFDVFWVFLSPFFFPSNVMVQVAKGGGTGERVPMLFQLPSFDDPLGGVHMLGFGDVALPGLLASFLLRHDCNNKKTTCNGYFTPVLLGYLVGIVLAMLAVEITRKGQPALFYIVPCTLGTTLVLSLWRKEFRLLWNGEKPGFQLLWNGEVRPEALAVCLV